MGMHAARVEKSPALQAILALLQQKGSAGATTWELHEVSNAMNPATEVSALRKNGFDIECQYEGTVSGRKIYRYWYRGQRLVQGSLFGGGATT